MKKICFVVVCVSLLSLLCGCIEMPERFTSDMFFCEVLEDDSVAIGDVSHNNWADYVFVQQQINGYTVKRLGFDSGLGYGGYLTAYSPNNYEFKRFYCPNTIEVVYFQYMQNVNNGMKVFYCGKVCNLGNLNIGNVIGETWNYMEFYVPNDLYSHFFEQINENCQHALRKANVCYMLNYETENEYYYVDYQDYGTKIEHRPPDPTREGYQFKGWYTEEKCWYEWVFDRKAIPELPEGQEYAELKLYAKWI